MATSARKLPGETVSYTYDLEYGTDTIEIQKDAILPQQRVVIVDDFLSNGRTAVALVEMAREAGATVLCASFIVEKRFKKGHATIEALGVPVCTLAQVEALENGRVALTQP